MLIGPNCLGVMVPAAKLNATFATRMALRRDLALVARSGAIAAGMVAWAAQRKPRSLFGSANWWTVFTAICIL